MLPTTCSSAPHLSGVWGKRYVITANANNLDILPTNSIYVAYTLLFRAALLRCVEYVYICVESKSL